jgi:hypothetical protein
VLQVLQMLQVQVLGALVFLFLLLLLLPPTLLARPSTAVWPVRAKNGANGDVGTAAMKNFYEMGAQPRSAHRCGGYIQLGLLVYRKRTASRQLAEQHERHVLPGRAGRR